MIRKIINSVVHNQAAGICALILCTTLVYSNIFNNEFVVDDYLFIVDWPMIRDLGNWPQFFGPDSQPKGEEGVYSPLKTLFHAINYNLWGTNLFGYHVGALLVHLLGTVFVYRISRQLVASGSVAFLCGLLFGLHPVHVEAITFIAASVDTSGVVFLFISFYYYIRSQEDHRRSRRYYIYSLLIALIAIFTHELAITLPLLFLFYDICLNQKISLKPKNLLKLSPFFASVFIYVVLKSVIFGSVARGGYLFGSMYLTMLVIIKVLAKYVLILFFPFKLSLLSQISKGIYAVDWQYFDREEVLLQSFFDIQVLLALFLTVAIVYMAIKSWKREPLLSFCIGWFYISLLPVLNIIPTESYYGERYLYPGSFGFCLGLAILLNKLYHYQGGKNLKCSGKTLSIAVTVVILLFYSVRTVVRNADWRNERTFYQAEALVNPDHPVMLKGLGIVSLRDGKLTEALGFLQKSIATYPLDEGANFALAEVYTKLGNYPKAIESYSTAINIKSDFAEAHYNLGGVYSDMGEMDMAQKSLKKAIELFEVQLRTFPGLYSA